MCSFYLRLTTGLDGFRVKIYIGFVLIVSTWLAVLFGILFGCGLPFKKNWQINPDPGNRCQPAVSRIDIFMTLIFNVLTDFYLMSIPLPLLWKSRVSRLKKAAMFFCFSGGIFVTTAGILRCVLIVTVSASTVSFILSPMHLLRHPILSATTRLHFTHMCEKARLSDLFILPLG